MKHYSPAALKALSDNYIWTVNLEGSSHFLVVDPGDADEVIAYANLFNLDLRYILLTHYHPDHMGGLDKLKRYFSNVTVYGADELKDFEDELVIADLSFNILFTPGHTQKDICFWEKNKGWLFCGDTLFSGGCGRIFDGTYEQLFLSIELLRHLPDQTKLYCAHEYTVKNLKFANMVEPSNKDIKKLLDYYRIHSNENSLPSSIALEKKINPFFRLYVEEIKFYLIGLGFEISNTYSVFKALRFLRNKY